MKAILHCHEEVIRNIRILPACTLLWWVFLNPGVFWVCFVKCEPASFLMNKTNLSSSCCVRTYLSFLPQDCLCPALLGAPRSPAGAASGSRTDGGPWSSRPSAAAGNISSPLDCCGQRCKRDERSFKNGTLELMTWVTLTQLWNSLPSHIRGLSSCTSIQTENPFVYCVFISF